MDGSPKKKKRLGFYYTMLIVLQWSTPMQTYGVRTSSTKIYWTPSSLEEGEDEGDEALSRGTDQIPFSSIPDDATISSKQIP